LLCLIVVIELPRQIADEKQEKAYGSNDPNGALIFKQASCHVEPSRLARRNFMRRRKTSLILNVHGFDSLTSHSLNLRSSRLYRGFPSRSILDFARNNSQRGQCSLGLTRATELHASAPRRPHRFLGVTPRGDKHRKRHCSDRAIQ